MTNCDKDDKNLQLPGRRRAGAVSRSGEAHLMAISKAGTGQHCHHCHCYHRCHRNLDGYIKGWNRCAISIVIVVILVVVVIIAIVIIVVLVVPLMAISIIKG